MFQTDRKSEDLYVVSMFFNFSPEIDTVANSILLFNRWKFWDEYCATIDGLVSVKNDIKLYC